MAGRAMAAGFRNADIDLIATAAHATGRMAASETGAFSTSVL